MAEQPQPLSQGAVTTVPAATPQVPAGSEVAPLPPLSGDQQIQFSDRDGSPVVKSVSELADAFRGRIPSEDQEKLTLYKKAFEQNDPAAIRSMYEQFMPEVPAPSATPEAVQEQLTATNKKIDDLTTLMQGQIQPTVQSINQQREVAVFDQSLKENVKDYPTTVAHPEGAMLAQQRYTALLEAFRQGGHDPDKFTPQIRQQVAIKASQDIEQFLAGTVQVFGGRIPGAVPSGPNVTSVNDQGQGAPPGVLKAPLQMTGQGYQDTRVPPGAPAPQTPLPGTPVLAPTGSAPGMVPDQEQNVPMTQSRLVEMMRARTQAATGMV